MLDHIKEETQFLLELKLREQMNALTPEQKDVVQITAVLRYIGVEGQEDLDLLVGIFYQGQEVDDEGLMVDADEVLKYLELFIVAQQARSSSAVRAKSAGRLVAAERRGSSGRRSDTSSPTCTSACGRPWTSSSESTMPSCSRGARRLILR